MGYMAAYLHEDVSTEKSAKGLAGAVHMCRVRCMYVRRGPCQSAPNEPPAGQIPSHALTEPDGLLCYSLLCLRAVGMNEAAKVTRSA